MIKKIVLGLAVLVVLIGAGGYYLFSNLDSYVKGAVEKYGSLATQSKVTLDSVKLELTTGDGSLNGLTVTNPQGFSSGKALYLGSIGVTLDTSSVRGTGPIIIKQVIIDKPQVAYELLNNGDSNLTAIQKNTQAFANSLQGKAASSGNPASKDVVKDNAPPRKIIISDLVIRNGQVSVSQEMLQGKQLTTPLPDIHLTNIGKDSGGATAGQIAEQVLSSITSAASQSALATLAKNKISGILQQVPAASIGKGAVDQVGTQLKGVFGQ
jgi:hypothetical protein